MDETVKGRRPIIVLEALLKGQIVDVSGEKFVLDSGELCEIRVTEQSSGSITEALIPLNWTLGAFVSYFKKVSMEDIIFVSAERAFNKMRRDENFKNVN